MDKRGFSIKILWSSMLVWLSLQGLLHFDPTDLYLQYFADVHFGVAGAKIYFHLSIRYFHSLKNNLKRYMMFLEKLSYLPEWNERLITLGDEGDEWKTKPALAAAKVLYNQWRQVFDLAIAIADSLDGNAKTGREDTKQMIYENLMIAGAKIMSAAGNTMYIIKMENAAIIRVNCRQLMEQVGFASMVGMVDERHKKVLKEEMGKFIQLFRDWVSTFRKDEFEDEWGLF